jgi:hypothetical protein
MSTVILVCGGRAYRDKAFLEHALDMITGARSVSVLIEGGALGADRLAREWAVKNGVHVATVNALWSRGKGAGLARNRAMLALRPDYVVAFPGGRGTQNMMAQAERAGVRVLRAGWTE